MKKKRTVAIIILMILVVGVFLVFYLKTNKDKKDNGNQVITSMLEEFGENDVYIGLNRTYIDIYKDTCYSNIDFYIYTTKKIEEIEKVSANIENFQAYKFVLSEEYEQEEFPDYVYECYEGIDWKELYDLWEKDETLYTEKLDSYKEGYEKSKDKVKKLYRYQACLAGIDPSKITSENSIFQVKNITVNIDGKDYHCQPGGIRFYNQCLVDDETQEDEKIELTYLGNSPKNMYYSEIGEVMVQGLEFTCNEAVTLKEIHLIDRDDCTIQESILEVESDGDIINTKLKEGKTFECNKGDKVAATLKVKDEKFEGQLEYSTVYYFEIVYDYKGKEYKQNFETGYATRTNAYEILGKNIDKINIDSFYADYYNKAIGESE